MHDTVPSRYTVRIVASGGDGPRFELFDTEARRGVKSYRSHALAVSDMTFLNSLLAAERRAASERFSETHVMAPVPSRNEPERRALALVADRPTSTHRYN